MKKITSIILAGALLFSMTACTKKADTKDVQNTDPSATSQTESTQPTVSDTVIVNQFTETGMLAAGQTVTLNADTLTGEITWSSSHPEFATVDESGTVTALEGRGAVTITAQSGNQTQQWQIPLCQETAFGNVSLNHGEESLTIGVWSGAFQWFDEPYMQLMADAGIDLIIGVKDKWIWEGDGAPVLDLAAEYGISILADLRDWDGETLPEYVNYEGLLGFLLCDEPSSTYFQHLVNMNEQFQLLMPEDLLFFVNLFPESCGYESLYGDSYNPAKVDYEEHYLNLFMDTVGTELISYDGYPLQEGGTIRSPYYHNFDIASHRAQKDGVPFWYTLCSSGHYTTDGRYLTPTEDILRWQMLMGMTYGATTLSHYVLTSPEEGDDNMLQYLSWQPTEVYDRVKTVNHEFLNWDDIYMDYTWVGTASYDAAKTKGYQQKMLASLEYALPMEEAGVLTGVQSDESLLIGVFQKDDQNAYLITNAGAMTPCEKYRQYAIEMQDATVTLQLADGNYRCAAVINRGNIRYVPVNEDNTVDVTVSAYDGVFVIPVV